jgi:hypothetical protein
VPVPTHLVGSAFANNFFDKAVPFSCYKDSGAQKHKLLGEREIGENPILSSQQ